MPCPEKFRDSLSLFNVPQTVADEINAGCETLSGASPKIKNAP